MEEYMQAYNQCYGLNCVALRYSNVYGSGMRWDDPICLAAMRRSAHERGYVELTGDGLQSRDFTHVSDIVEGTIQAAVSDYKGIVDLTSEDHHSMWDMAAYFDVPIRYVPARVGDTAHIIQLATMARKLFGWAPRVSVKDGMEDVLRDVPAKVEATA
jgi:UDP-glucose 4-epimerase